MRVPARQNSLRRLRGKKVHVIFKVMKLVQNGQDKSICYEGEEKIYSGNWWVNSSTWPLTPELEKCCCYDLEDTRLMTLHFFGLWITWQFWHELWILSPGKCPWMQPCSQFQRVQSRQQSTSRSLTDSHSSWFFRRGKIQTLIFSWLTKAGVNTTSLSSRAMLLPWHHCPAVLGRMSAETST